MTFDWNQVPVLRRDRIANAERRAQTELPAPCLNRRRRGSAHDKACGKQRLNWHHPRTIWNHSPLDHAAKAAK